MKFGKSRINVRLLAIGRFRKLTEHFFRFAKAMGAPPIIKRRWKRLRRLIQEYILAQHLREIEDITIEESTRYRALILIYNGHGPERSWSRGFMSQLKLLFDIELDRPFKILRAAAAR